MFKVNGITFLVGDIVEKHYNGRWNYWTTIQHQWDADAAVALSTTFYRVVRGPEKELIW